MTTCFSACETLEMAVPEEKIAIQHYLRQPQRLVTAIADPSLMETLSPQQFRLKMRPLNFMDIYHFQPTVVLQVWTEANGTVHLRSESCEIRGIDYINNRFNLKLSGKLFPYQRKQQTYLKGRADLRVNVELPPPLWLTPQPLLEMTGNGLLKGVLSRIKQRLLNQLLKDYQKWARQPITNQPMKQGTELDYGF
ncbi:MAG: DUF1997 domain-containing protein [Microcystaceae cyanobacterium]